MMRLNKFVALATGISRRKADDLISQSLVTINDTKASLGSQVTEKDTIRLNGEIIKPAEKTTILINKPVGYVCSRSGQGSATIYDLIPDKYHSLKPVGRLDKDSSGLLLITSDGELANQLTHPRYQKEKTYQIELNRDLAAADIQKISQSGVELDDGLSKFELTPTGAADKWIAILTEGRNRQIRRTLDALGYRVVRLHRTKLGPYSLAKQSESGSWEIQTP